MKAPATDQKLRGGYYTPDRIADFLADWAIRCSSDSVLEPSCGDGNILTAAAATLVARGGSRNELARQLQGVEIDPAEAQKALDRLASLSLSSADTIWVGDFLDYCEQSLFSERRFDVAIGNPPFIRYQNFQEEHRAVAFRLLKHAGLRPTRLMNAWVPFVVASTLLLKPDSGRLAMVIPAELMQVGYAADLRRFLTDHFDKIILITFRKLVFDGIQQEVVLFLGERGGRDGVGIRTIELTDTDDLARFSGERLAGNHANDMDHSSEKWTQYYLDSAELHLLRAFRKDPRLTPASKVMSVDVGLVTGLNEFFVLTEEQATAAALMDHTQPIVTRSAHLSGIQFTQDDLAANTSQQRPARLLSLPDVPLGQLPDAVQNYILAGEKQGAHQGYKCRIRKHWYVVPSVWTPDAFMLRQVHSFPKMILNLTGATSTDTIHRVRFHTARPWQAIIAAFLNSLTFAFAEITGRSYGGGVLELEPNEADSLPLPLLNAQELDFNLLDTLVKRGDIESVLDITDQALLIRGLGLSQGDVTCLRTAWRRLRDRRIHRNHGSNGKERLPHSG